MAVTGAAARSRRCLDKSGFYTHLVMVTGILATGVGYALVINQPGDEDPLWLAVIIGGPALFLAGRSRLEYEVFARVSASRVIGLLALVALTPVMVRRAPVIVTSAAAVFLAGVAAWDGIREWRRPDEAPSVPRSSTSGSKTT